jgi:hypothetical protein
MINKIINLLLITIVLLIAMSIHPKDFKWWHYVIAGYVLPNASLLIWLVIEWIRFDPKEEIEENETN